jgi:hypothetical protein
LIGKAGLFNTVPIIGQPIAAVLRQVENVVDVSTFLLFLPNIRAGTKRLLTCAAVYRVRLDRRRGISRL